MSSIHSFSLAAFASTLCLAGCPPFQPEIAQRPAPYSRGSTFVAPGEVTHVPQLDRGTFSEPSDPALRTDPTELAATPGLVRGCLVSSLASGITDLHVVAAEGAPSEAFRLQLALVVARPGYFRADRINGVSASGSAPGANASGSAGVMTAGTSSTAQAEAILEVRAPTGAVVDRVRIYAQRTTRIGESLESRAANLCRELVEQVRGYLVWRLAS